MQEKISALIVGAAPSAGKWLLDRLKVKENIEKYPVHSLVYFTIILIDADVSYLAYLALLYALRQYGLPEASAGELSSTTAFSLEIAQVLSLSGAFVLFLGILLFTVLKSGKSIDSFVRSISDGRNSTASSESGVRI
jgi:hypothetical protein